MSSYRVNFFKDLLSSDGHLFSSLQQSVVIGCAKNAERAVQAAKRKFERRCQVPDWRLYADRIELEVDDKTICSRTSRRDVGPRAA